jgi:hypothetical protein
LGIREVAIEHDEVGRLALLDGANLLILAKQVKGSNIEQLFWQRVSFLISLLVVGLIGAVALESIPLDLPRGEL